MTVLSTLAQHVGTQPSPQQVQATALVQAIDAFLAKAQWDAVEKADPLWRILHRIADRAEPELKAAVLKAIADTIAGVDGSALRRALDAGNLNAAMQAIPWDEIGDTQLRESYTAVMSQTYQQAGAASAKQLDKQLGGLGVSFTLDNPRATAWAAEFAAERVTGISEETIAALRSVITRGFKEHRPPRDTARMIRGVRDPETGRYHNSLIGLTEIQANAVYSYRDELQNDNIERSTEREDRMVERYRDELVLQRAEMIARTETMTASNEGTQETWRQAKESGYLRGNERRVWMVTPDDRLCPFCEPMDGQIVGFDEEFQSDELDDVFVPPLHIQCRCVVGLIEADVQDTADTLVTTSTEAQ